MLHYRRAGSGPTIVLLHGFMGGSGYWQPLIGSWSDAFDVVAPDLPGFAGSAGEAPCTSIAGMAQRVLTLLDDIGVAEFILIGHSMGGMVAQELAAMAANRVAKLVLYGTGSTGVLPGRFESIQTSISRLRQDGVAATARRIAATWFVAGSDAPGYAMCLTAGEGTTIEAAAAALEALQGWDGRSQLQRLRMPVLVVAGDRDRSCTPARAFELWEGIDGCELFMLPNCAHAAHLEASELFGMGVRRFMDR